MRSPSLIALLLVLFTAGCPPPAEDCGNGKDDDNDGRIDKLDTDCAGAEGEGEGEAGEGEGDAGEGEGDAGEGEGDAGEGEGEGEGEGDPGPDCADGSDNDGDGFIDAADPACLFGQLNEADDSQCSDGLDNDFDGAADGDDSGCAAGHELAGGLMPDLIVIGEPNVAFTDRNGNPTDTSSPIVSQHNVADGDAERQEGCYTGSGLRTIIEFNSVVANVGTADLVVGNTSTHPPIWDDNNFLNPLQFAGWLRFTLLDSGGNVAAAGHKGSFCMVDIFDPGLGGTPQFSDCGSGQGISINYADDYSIGLPCEFVDVTGLASGSYTLRIETDVTHQLPELDYGNNSVDIGPFDLVLP